MSILGYVSALAAGSAVAETATTASASRALMRPTLYPRRRAEVAEHAVFAARRAGDAHAAAVPDQEVREDAPVLARDEPLDVAFDLHRVVLLRQAEPLRKAADVRVHDDSLRIAELGRDDVRGLARDSGQLDELLEPPRHPAVVHLEQALHRPADRLRLLAEEPGRIDVALELLDRDGEVILGPPVLLEQRRGDAIDVHVGRLRGEHHGDEQLQLRPEGERDPRVRVRGDQALDDRADTHLLRPDAAACL